MLYLGGLILDAVCEEFSGVAMRSWGPVLENSPPVGTFILFSLGKPLHMLLKLLQNEIDEMKTRVPLSVTGLACSQFQMVLLTGYYLRAGRLFLFQVWDESEVVILPGEQWFVVARFSKLQLKRNNKEKVSKYESHSVQSAVPS